MVVLYQIYTDELIEHGGIEDRLEIASLPNLSDRHIERLIHDEDWSVREKVAVRTDLVPEQIDHLARDKYYGVREKIASRNVLSPKLVDLLIKDESTDVRMAIARRKELTAEQIDLLAGDESRFVREEVASRADLVFTIEQIRRGLKDPEPDIRAAWNERLAEHVARGEAHTDKEPGKKKRGRGRRL